MEADRRFWFQSAAFSCAVAVGLGAFGAHGLKARISDEKMLANWSTGALYHFIHSFGLFFTALSPRMPKSAAYGFAVGIALFSGSLYAMVLTNKRWLGAITPIGGTAFIFGWIMLGIYGI
eukprot:TRINITY_DN9441_c0_g1_i1.p1 TRINITY_DN9441_c0_g1~~TRINITY_DN9441_c0_g1_i1.p1  ORF type:complete len:120 (+),score=17.03 TRINITY_DN9441_c0_g1_i1:22-381(+)